MIVCGGVIGSAQLLLLSGIGAADDLRALPSSASRCGPTLPGVGANLHDHALATVLYESSQTIPEGKANNLEAHLFAAQRPGHAHPDLQPLMSGSFPMPVEGYPQPAYGDGYAIVAGLIRPLSRGRLWLRSADPAEHPAIDRSTYPSPRHPGPARQPEAIARDRPGPAPSRTGAPARSPPAPTSAPTRSWSSTACAT